MDVVCILVYFSIIKLTETMSVLIFKISNNRESEISFKILIQIPLASTQIISIYYNPGEDGKQ